MGKASETIMNDTNAIHTIYSLMFRGGCKVVSCKRIDNTVIIKIVFSYILKHNHNLYEFKLSSKNNEIRYHLVRNEEWIRYY